MKANSIHTRNAFESLCDLASRNMWCWRIFCETCGHICFRYAFELLAGGKHPDSREWRLSDMRDVIHKRRNDLGLPYESGWTITAQRDLSKIMSDAHLQTIALNSRFPDWLAYLGLGLRYTEEVEREEHRLTNAWKPQLVELLNSRVAQIPTALLDAKRRLRWSDLEAVEIVWTSLECQAPVTAHTMWMCLNAGIWREAGTRVCPRHGPWIEIFERLEKYAQCHPCVPPSPPGPMVLSGWSYSLDIDKFMRWKEMVAWAVSNGCDEIVSKIPERDYYHLRGCNDTFADK